MTRKRDKDIVASFYRVKAVKGMKAFNYSAVSRSATNFGSKYQGSHPSRSFMDMAERWDNVDNLPADTKKKAGFYLYQEMSREPFMRMFDRFVSEVKRDEKRLRALQGHNTKVVIGVMLEDAIPDIQKSMDKLRRLSRSPLYKDTGTRFALMQRIAINAKHIGYALKLVTQAVKGYGVKSSDWQRTEKPKLVKHIRLLKLLLRRVAREGMKDPRQGLALLRSFTRRWYPRFFQDYKPYHTGSITGAMSTYRPFQEALDNFDLASQVWVDNPNSPEWGSLVKEGVAYLDGYTQTWQSHLSEQP
jgi:hypothetical protein